MNKRVRRIWLLVSFFAAGGLAPFLVRGSFEERERLSTNREQIEDMTQTERLRLERSFDEFQQMTPADQAKYRELHSRIVADEQENGLHVDVMDAYYDWLSTVRGDQRERLRKETEPQARRQLVEQIINEQQAPPPEFGSGGFGPGRPSLTSGQLDIVFAIFEAEIPFTDDQRAQLESLSGLKKHLKLLEFLIERFRASDSDNSSVIRTVFQRLHELTILRQAIDALDDSSFQEQILQHRDGPGRGFGDIIFWSIFAELQTYRVQHAPNDADLDRAFSSMSEAEQDELLQLGSQDFRWRLRHRFYETQLRELSTSPAILQIFQPWRYGRGGWRGGGGGRSGFGGSGNGPPGEGREGSPRGPGPFSDGQSGPPPDHPREDSQDGRDRRN
jgi:hypothetical protein